MREKHLLLSCGLSTYLRKKINNSDFGGDALWKILENKVRKLYQTISHKIEHWL